MVLKIARLMEWNLRKYLLGQNTYTVGFGSFKIALDLRTPGISRTLAIHRARERDHTLIFKTEVAKGMRVLDIGANIGYYTMMAATLVGRNGKVFAFEPDPRNLNILELALRANPGIANIVEIHPLAVSNRVGETIFYQTAASNLNTLIHGEQKQTINRFSVKTITVDEFLANKGGTINFVRMDIEGSEIEAVEGMLNTLKLSEVPCKLLIETHPDTYSYPDRDFGLRLETLYSIGFKPKIIISAGEAIPEEFSKRGYKPSRIMREGRFLRGFFENVARDHVIYFVTHVPKLVRYILLIKE